MTEQIITKALYFHLLWKKGYKIVTHQFDNRFGKADIFGVNKSLYTHEMEIKVTKSDFMSEIVDIKKIISGEITPQLERGSKHQKHEKYITGKNCMTKDWGDGLVPTYFSYVVPSELVQFASEHLKYTPYGLIEYTHPRVEGRRGYFETKIKAKKLNDLKVDFGLLMGLAHRMTWICEKLISEK